MKLEDGLKKYESLDRQQYFDKNQELSKKLWSAPVPTVADIVDFINGNDDNENMNMIFDFFDNKENFSKMINRKNHDYDQDESTAFIRKVMSANNDDISKAGYFYKLLMASADDFKIREKDCESKGLTINLSELNEELFSYRIKFAYVTEFKGFMRLSYDSFTEWIKAKNLTEINIRTPLSCNLRRDHCLCKKCSGALPKNTLNIGTFTTLMVTESATQSALSSMNKGRQDNINDILAMKYKGKYDWEEIESWVQDIVDSLQNSNVSSRFYEIALLSRVRIDYADNTPFVSSLKSSISRSGNLFGSYIFTPNNKEFEKIVRKGNFEDNSLKLQIAMNDFEKYDDLK